MNLCVPFDLSFRQLERPDGLDTGLEYLAVCVEFELLLDVLGKCLQGGSMGKTANNSATFKFPNLIRSNTVLFYMTYIV